MAASVSIWQSRFHSASCKFSMFVGVSLELISSAVMYLCEPFS